MQLLDERISELTASHQVGPLLLLTESLKAGLMSETRSWKLAYGRALNQTCANDMDMLFEFFGSMQKRLSRPVKDLDDIRALMSAMTEIREAEIRTDLTIIPIEEAYGLLARHGIIFDDGNAERVDSLGYSWRLLQQKVSNFKFKCLFPQVYLNFFIRRFIRLLFCGALRNKSCYIYMALDNCLRKSGRYEQCYFILARLENKFQHTHKSSN